MKKRRAGKVLDLAPNFLWYLLVMAGTTYLVRMLPLVLFRKKIRNRYIRSFLYYIPYSVLTVMTVPAIFFSTGHIISAIAGTLVALTLSYKRKSLIVVALFAAFAVLCAELVIFHLTVQVL